jgi:hypothetical protein
MLIAWIAAIFWSTRLGFRIAERIVLPALYGDAAYASGLRVINKQGGLSNGGHLPAGLTFVMVLASFVCCTVPTVIGGGLLLIWAGLIADPRKQRTTTAQPPAPKETLRPATVVPPQLERLFGNGIMFRIGRVVPIDAAEGRACTTMLIGRLEEGRLRVGQMLDVPMNDGSRRLVAIAGIEREDPRVGEAGSSQQKFTGIVIEGHWPDVACGTAIEAAAARE